MRFIVEIPDHTVPKWADVEMVREELAGVSKDATCTIVKDDPHPSVNTHGTRAPRYPYQVGSRLDLRMYESKVDVRIKDSDEAHIDADYEGDDSWVDRHFIYKPTAGTDGPMGETEVNLVSSRMIQDGMLDTEMHVPFIDVDMPVWLIPSKTPGHFHLCFPSNVMSWRKYKDLLLALAKAGIISHGYATACIERQCSMIRAWPTPTGFKDDVPVEGWPRRVIEDREVPMQVQMGPFDDGIAATYKRSEEAKKARENDHPPIKWSQS